MTELKTQKTDASVIDFINAVEPETKKQDSLTLLKVFKEATGMEAAMWGTSIVGYGTYHYKSERSAQEGDWMLTGFSPRKQNLTVYIMPGFKKYQKELAALGKAKTSVSCIYINKLADIDLDILKAMIKDSVKVMKKDYGVR